MLLSIEGPEKTAKTTFAYTAPLPIVGFQFDLGADRAINGTKFDKYFKGLKIESHTYNRFGENNPEPIWDGNDITYYNLPKPLQLDSTDIRGYIALWNYFISLLGTACSDSNIATIVLDTGTLARDTAVNKYLEELNQKAEQTTPPSPKRKQLLQIEYGHPNSVIENIYTLMASLNKNFIVVHHTRPERKNQLLSSGEIANVETGQLELDGWNKTYRFVDTAIRNSLEKGVIQSEIIVCGDNLNLVGTKLPNMDWNMLVDLISGSLEGRKQYGKRE